MLLLLTVETSLMFASPVQTALSRTDLAQRGQGIGPGGPGIHHQQNGQFFQGINNNGVNATFVGAGQGNSGNLGIKKGVSNSSSI